MKIFLGDLGHYTIKLTNNCTPINIGFIAAYVHRHLQGKVQIQLFKNPQILIDAICREKPDILALSNYVWCQSISELVMKHYKRIKPNGITVWGGPNFSMNEIEKAKSYLLNRPYVDFYIPFEGELPMLNIARTVLERGNSITALKKHHADRFRGSFFITHTGELIGNKIGLQIPDINEIPSPYLTGWLDPFLTNEGLHAMFETQRGCPYSCTFCHTGLKYYNHGRSFSLDRLKNEIRHIIATVADPSRTTLMVTDANFGMWPQDLELTKWLRGVYEKTGFPLAFGTTTGKGRMKLVLETVMSHPKLMLNHSVQSMDNDVLKVIKRKNFPIEQLKESQVELDAAGKLSKPELILGLPSETKESHLNTLRKLTNEIGSDLIYQYTAMMLPGTEMYTDESRAKYRNQVRYRMLPTAYGEYAGEKCFEIEEVSIATKDMSFEEYLELRVVFFFVHNIHSNPIFNALTRYLRYLGEDEINFFLYLMKARESLPVDEFSNKILSAYLNDTKRELFESREELIRYYADSENYKKLLDGKSGLNLTHTYRAQIFLNSDSWAKWVTASFRNYLLNRSSVSEDMCLLIDSIVSHVNAQAKCQKDLLNRSAHIPDATSPLNVELEYDIPSIFARGINLVPKSLPVQKKRIFSYYMRNDAIKYIRSYETAQRMVDIALTVLRMDLNYLIPICKQLEEEYVTA